MATPKVNLRRIKRKNSIVYLLDYRIDGERFRETVGTNKKLAEEIQRNRESDFKELYVRECFNAFLEKKVNGKSPWAKKTVNGLRAIVKEMFTYAKRSKYISDNPVIHDAHSAFADLLENFVMRYSLTDQMFQTFSLLPLKPRTTVKSVYPDKYYGRRCSLVTIARKRGSS